MFSDERANELMDQIMELVCPTFFDAAGGFQCSGSWPEGKDQSWFEIRVYPAVVELLGGKDDGETVYQGFHIDLKALQKAVFPLFDEVEEWELDNAIGQADGGDDTLTVHVCTSPPEDAEPIEKHPVR